MFLYMRAFKENSNTFPAMTHDFGTNLSFKENPMIGENPNQQHCFVTEKITQKIPVDFWKITKNQL